MFCKKNMLWPGQDEIVGVGLRSKHMKSFLRKPKKIGWLEIHPENFFCGGLNKDLLVEIAKKYPISFHGVGLSLGSYEPVNLLHLTKLKNLIDEIKPFIISEHASWSLSGNAHTNDLLPLPHNYDSLSHLCDNIMRTQDFLGRKILIENPSTYVEFVGPIRQEEFIQEAAIKTKCGILLDLNNVYVNSVNHGYDPYSYIDYLESALIEEIHVAGHYERNISDSRFLIDTHDTHVSQEVWNLYNYFIQSKGVKLSMLEWDAQLPSYNTLIDEANKIKSCIGKNVLLLREAYC